MPREGLPHRSDHFEIAGTLGDVVHYWPQFFAARRASSALVSVLSTAIRPVKPSFLPVQLTANVPDRLNREDF
jgi:hypothetical protein